MQMYYGIHTNNSYLIDNNIEMVQRRAARWVKQDYRLTSSVSNMIEDLQWLTLCELRKYSRLTTFYKFLHRDPPDTNIPDRGGGKGGLRG